MQSQTDIEQLICLSCKIALLPFGFVSSIYRQERALSLGQNVRRSKPKHATMPDHPGVSIDRSYLLSGKGAF